MALAILPNWLGDLVMVEPALRALRRRAPVTGVVAPGLAPLVGDAGLVDRIEIFDRRGADRGVTGLLRAGGRLRGAEQAWVFGPSLRAAALAAASRAPRRTGYGGAGREIFLNDVRAAAHPPRSRHLADEWLALVEPGATARCTWEVGDAGRAGLERLLAAEPALGGPFVALAPSARYGPTKEWPVADYVELAGRLAGRGLRPVFIGADDPHERRRADQLARASEGISVAGRTDLVTLAALLTRARLFVGNDSGAMHLAAAAGTPTVGIFGSTSPEWTAPRGSRVRVAGPAPVSCTPCFRPDCPWDRECLTGIGVDAVESAAIELLGAGT